MKKKIIFFLFLFFVVVSSFYYLFLKKERIKINSIFLITIDTIRADHLSCYNYPRKVTPFIDSLAKDGIIFTSAYSNSSTTAPAHSSIFTGLYPITHGVLKNWIKLDDNFQTLAEILKEEGFKTVAFTGVELFKACNLYQGFEYYNEPENAREKWGKKYRSARLTFGEIKKFFSQKKVNGKYFIWIHFFDPHRPYYPPQKFIGKIKQFNDKEKMIRFWENVHKINPEVYKGEVFRHRERSNFFKKEGDLKHENMTAEDIMYEQINLYDAEIIYVDKVLEEIFNFFEEIGFNKNSLWIITGDHGEGLGNHNWFMHGKHIYRELIHIPLIFYFREKRIRKKESAVVEHTNILPTILEILKIKKYKKENRLNGVSMLPLILGQVKKYNKRFSFAQREKYKFRKMKKIPDYLIYEKGDKFSVIDDRFHFIYNITTGREEFFDIRKDPYEILNLSSTIQSEKGKYKAQLLKTIKNLKKKRKTKKATAKEIEKIKSLGYVD